MEAAPATAATGRPRSSDDRRDAAAWIGRVGGIALGAVLLIAALAKSLDPAAFAEEIAALGLAGPLPPAPIAIAALAFEALLGGLLVTGVRRLPILIGATLLVALFLGLTGRSAWREARGIEDPAGACGCFGNLVDRTPAEAFRQDLLLLTPALALSWLGRPGARRGDRARAAVSAAVALGVGAFAVAAPRLPLDDRATRLAPGVLLAEICAGRGEERVCLSDLAPELGSGTHIVVLADVESDRFGDLAERLNERLLTEPEPPVSLLAEISPERRRQLFWTIGPAFELHDAPRAMLRPLYRSLPRTFRVEEGRVSETWSGLPPAFSAASAAADPRSNDEETRE